MKKIFYMITLIFSLTAFPHGGEKHDSIDKGPSKVAPEIKIDIKNEVNKEYKKSVKPIFERSCFNCHSDQTIYPWYYKIPIAKQLIDHDIKEAKEHLDLSKDFPFGGHGKPIDDLKEIKKSIEKNKMPLWYYKLFNPKSKLSDSERKIIYKWIDESIRKLEVEQKK